MENILSFEQSIERLEEIVGKLEKGNVPLEEAIAAYQEGIQLSQICAQKLQEAEGKILKIANKDTGTVEEFHVSPKEV